VILGRTFYKVTGLFDRCLWYFSFMGFYPFDLQGVVLQLAVVSLAATLVESLPITNRFDDNLTVPLTTVILGLFLFPTRSIAGVLP
jgi:dolichol kinase